MESNHRPSLAGTVFKTACAPCAPSSVVGAERIELPTSCSQSKRATAALRPENGCWQHSAPGHSLECVLADERSLLPTSKRAGLDTGYRKSARACSVPEPCPPRCIRFPGMGAARLLRVPPRRRFDVGPRYFPEVVRVQRLRKSSLVLRLGYIDPAESFAFPLLACTSPTSKRTARQ